MNLKEVFKPTPVKIFLTLVFLALSFLFKSSVTFGVPMSVTDHGFPYPFYSISGAFTDRVTVPQKELIPFGLVIDAIFWYLISTTIIALYNKFKK